MQTAGKQVRAAVQASVCNPRLNCRPRLLRDLELHGALSLLLKNNGPTRNIVAVRDISDAQFYQVACSQLAVDRQIEQGQIADSSLKLQSNSDGPDVSKPQGCLLAD